MTNTVASDFAPASGGAGHPDAPPRPLPSWVLPVLLGGGVLIAAVTLAVPSEVARSIVFNVLGIVAVAVRRSACSATAREAHRLVVDRRQPRVVRARRHPLRHVVIAFGHDTGYPYSDVLYLLAYPCFAAGLYGLSFVQFRRDAAIDGAIVAASVSAVIWHWVITPIIDSSSGAAIERVVTVLYPVMDIVLMIAIVHAVFTLTKWRASAWLLFCGLGVMLTADTVYVQMVADGTSGNSTGSTRCGRSPTSCSRGPALHPSMRDLWQSGHVGPAQIFAERGWRCSARRCSPHLQS